MTAVEVSLLGGFEVRLDGLAVPRAAWHRRPAAALVKLLALAPRRERHRERVIDALWPDRSVAEAGPRLHKAAHYARRALGPDSVALHNDVVALFPDRPVDVDTARFEALASEALGRGDPASAEAAIEAYRGALLPEDPYEPWTHDARDRLAALHLRLLRQAGRHAELVELEPTDVDAHLALVRQLVARGDRRAALRQYSRMERVLRSELGAGPSDEAVALRDSLLAPEVAGLDFPVCVADTPGAAEAPDGGGRRAEAVTAALRGEEALRGGDTDSADREFARAADLCREIGAATEEAHCLQRLAQVRLARGDRASANHLLRRALPLARWSEASPHLLPRVYAAMVTAAADDAAARAVLDAATATLAGTDRCPFCDELLRPV